MRLLKKVAASCAALVLVVSATVVAAGSILIDGTLMSVSSSSLFIISSNGEHVEVSVPATARIVRDGEPAKLEDLQSRDQVSVKASDGGEHVATDVFARSPY